MLQFYKISFEDLEVIVYSRRAFVAVNAAREVMVWDLTSSLGQQPRHAKVSFEVKINKASEKHRNF